LKGRSSFHFDMTLLRFCAEFGLFCAEFQFGFVNTQFGLDKK